MGNRVCFTFFKPNVSQRLFTLRYSLSLALCHHSPAIPSIALCDHATSVSPTLFHQTPLPILWSLPYPFRTCRRWLQVRCSAVLLFCAAFVLWEMDDYQRGISHYQNIQFFSICFVGMTQVQVLCREENMIISASYIFYYLKMCWKSSVWYCQNKWLLWKELRNSCIFEDSNWLKTWLESLLIRYIWLIGLVSGVLRNSNPLLDFT